MPAGYYCGPAFQLLAGANVWPGSVAAISLTVDFTVLSSVLSTSPNIGIIQLPTRRAPGTADDDGTAAHNLENVGVFGVGCIAGAIVATGSTVTRGDTVTASTQTWTFTAAGGYSAVGGLITTTATAAKYVGYALQSGAAGDEIAVVVMPGVY